MINLTSIRVSYHFQNDRQGRKERIDRIINNNFGQVVLEEYYKGAWRCLTDTGLIFIVSEAKDLILTYYFAPMETVICMYKAMGRKVPQAVENKVRKNAKTYKRIYQENINERG